MCKFGILILGGSGKIFVQVSSSCVSGPAHRILSPTWEYYLGTVVCAVHVKFGIRNVHRVHLTDI